MRNPIIFVAELGSMHRRDKSLAYEMMRQAKLAGASFAKFQFGHPEDDEIRYIDDWAEFIAQWSEDIGIPWFASIFSQDGLSAARSVGMQQYKVAHQIALDSSKKGLLEDIIAMGKPTYISGKLTTSWFRNGQDDIYSIYVEAGKYPNYRPHMPMEFNDWYGYSSHAHGIGDALLAVGRGARYIEKHFCLSKPDLWVRDTTFALLPEEFARMVRYGNEVARAAGYRSS